MSKVLKWFPLNRKVEKGVIKSLLMVLLKYIGVWLLAVIAMTIIGIVPLFKGFANNIIWLYGWYMKIGLVLGCIQCFVYETSPEQEYYNINSLAADIQSSTYKWKYHILLGVLVLCMIPYGNINHAIQKNKAEKPEHNKEYVEVMEDNDSDTAETIEKESTQAKEPEEQMEQEKVEVVSEEQKKFHEAAKGFWRGDGISYTFMEQKGQYIFFSSESKGDALTNENFHISYYTVDSLEERDTVFYANVSDNSGRKYEIEVSKQDQDRRNLKLKSEEDSAWIPMVCNNCYSFEELLEKDTYTVYWKDDTYYNPYMADDTQVAQYSASSEDDMYCLLDVTDYTEGEELIIKGDNDDYTAWGIRDGIVTPFFSYFSFRDMECYDPVQKMFWYYYDGGTSGGSFYCGYTYNEEEDHFVSISESDIAAISERSEPIILCGFDEDYRVAVLAEEERLAQEAAEAADKTIVLEEMVVTESLDSYIDSYENEGFTIKIETLTDENCHFELLRGEDGHSVALGKRVTDGMPDGTYVYHCGGTVVHEVLEGFDSSFYAFDVYVVLKPDGSIFVENTKNAELKLPEGTYR